MNLVLLNILILLELPLDGSQRFKLLLQFGLLQDQIKDRGGELLHEGLVESESGGVAMLVELEDELGVEVEEDVDPFDKFFQDLEGPLRLDDGGFAKSLLEVVDYLYVPLFGLLEGLGLSRFHYVTPRIYIHPI